MLARVAHIIDATPDDAVVQLRITGKRPAVLTAARLRSLSGDRNVT